MGMNSFPFSSFQKRRQQEEVSKHQFLNILPKGRKEQRQDSNNKELTNRSNKSSSIQSSIQFNQSRSALHSIANEFVLPFFPFFLPACLYPTLGEEKGRARKMKSNLEGTNKEGKEGEGNGRILLSAHRCQI
mmetsp:Transcript_12983/g.25400  ORF Transcript_12983/g.25400 Transcript_12983/m.25400 type:complete len:132 (-) Transcript_12983:2321-2716(-)